MKTPILTTFKSKTAKSIFAVAILALAGVTACKKDAASTTITEADAAQVTTDAVVPSSGGLVTQTTASVSLYATAAPVVTCGAIKDTTITGASLAGALATYNYSLNWNYTLDCGTGIFTANFTGSSNYSGPLTSETGASTGVYTLTGISPTATNYAYTGTFERKGSATSKIAQQKSFTSDLKIVSSNTLVSKTTLEIVSGTAAVTLDCVTSGGKTFSFGGTITFLGNKKGTLVLNSGTSYAISWN